MKEFIKRKLREDFIDGQNMNKATQEICDKMTISSYEEALYYVKQALKNLDEKSRYDIMQKIHAPLENLKHAELHLKQEITSYAMTDDSLSNGVDIYWHEIQKIICEPKSTL